MDLLAIYLPANTTNLLQVCDLVINGQIKSHIRKDNAFQIYGEFKLWKRNYEVMSLSD
jgi:hypothetical protein